MSSPQVWVSKVTDAPRASTEQQDIAGSIRFIGNKVYKYVLLKAAPTADVDAVATDGLCYTDYSAHEVGTDFTDIEATNLGAGITTGAIDMSVEKGFSVWIQIKGPATLNTAVANSPVAGNDIQCHTVDLTFTKSVTLVQRIGTFVSATGNDEVILDCPF